MRALIATLTIILLVACGATLPESTQVTTVPAVKHDLPVINGVDWNDYKTTCDDYNYSILEAHQDCDGWWWVRVDIGCKGECDFIDAFLPASQMYQGLEDDGSYISLSSQGMGPLPCEYWEEQLERLYNHCADKRNNGV